MTVPVPALVDRHIATKRSGPNEQFRRHVSR
jgi:hypothetical protein